jgi:SAM-dependent methyltransferase
MKTKTELKTSAAGHPSRSSKKYPFDKYDLYRRAVQSPEEDVKFYLDRWQDIWGKKRRPTILREDFCGTGAISCEWVKLNKAFKSVGLDLDDEPMAYGREHYMSQLTHQQRERVVLVKKDVLRAPLPRADIVAAVNFSYFFFKQRQVLRHYFYNVYDSLMPGGIFLVDSFGGTQCTDAIVDRTRHAGFTYFWDQKYFDPVTNEAEFGIHFKVKNRLFRNVFTYDWRMWSLLEVQELMAEVGFREVQVFWEGTNSQGGGNGKFTRVTKGEACLSWIAYVVGVKK